MRKWIICSGPDWYRPSVTSTKQLVRQFEQDGYRVLWVNPIAFKSPFVNSSSRSSAWRKIINKLRTHLNGFRRVRPGFWVLVPFYIPSFSFSADRMNRVLIAAQVRLCSLLLGMRIRKTVLWISGSFTAEAILPWSFFRKVYQAADLLSGFRDASPALKQKLEARERDLCRRCHAVFAASEKIEDGLRTLCGDCEHIRVLHHGVDFAHFSSEGAVHPDMKILREKGLPVAGYFGSLSDANDKEVLLALAENGFSVVLIGKVLGDYSELESHPNISFVGPVDYEILPTYACGFDVGLLNWRAAEWIENSFPVKALEYLAAGLPVVSCPIPVLMEHFAQTISFVTTPDEFVREARHLVEADNPESRMFRQDAVRSWSWSKRFDRVKETLAL